MSTTEALPDFEQLMRDAVASRRADVEAAREKAREEALMSEAARLAFMDRMSDTLRDVGGMLERLSNDPVIVDRGLRLRCRGYEVGHDKRERHVWMLGGKLVFSVFTDTEGAHSLAVAGRGPTPAIFVQLRPGYGPHGSRAAVPLDYDAFLRWIAGRPGGFGVDVAWSPSMSVLRVDPAGDGSIDLRLDIGSHGIPAEGYLVSRGTALRYSVSGHALPCLVNVRDAGEGMALLEVGATVVAAKHDSPVGREIARVHEGAERARIEADAADALLVASMTKRFDEVAAAVDDLAAALRSTPSGRLLCGAVPAGTRRIPEGTVVGSTIRKKSETITVGRIEVGISCVTRRLREDGAKPGADPADLPVVIQVSFTADDVRPHICTYHWMGGPLDRKAMVAEVMAKAAAFMVADQEQDEDIRHGDWDIHADPEQLPPSPEGR